MRKGMLLVLAALAGIAGTSGADSLWKSGSGGF